MDKKKKLSHNFQDSHNKILNGKLLNSVYTTDT